jgi:hypothetical protein
MTRAEVADAVNAWLWRRRGEVFTIDANHIGKYELGECRWPHEHYRTALCAVLGAVTPAELGF